MGLNFFEHLAERNRRELMHTIEHQEGRKERPDPFEALANSVELKRFVNREELEQWVRQLDVRKEDVERHCCGCGEETVDAEGCGGNAKRAGGGAGKERKVIVKNAVLECALCDWPEGADIFSIVHARGFEVVRVWSGKLFMTGYYMRRGSMEAYCVAELGAGSVVSLPPAVIYRFENRGKETARAFHFLSPPLGLVPASEGIRKLYERRGSAVF